MVAWLREGKRWNGTHSSAFFSRVTFRGQNRVWHVSPPPPPARNSSSATLRESIPRGVCWPRSMSIGGGVARAATSPLASCVLGAHSGFSGAGRPVGAFLAAEDLERRAPDLARGPLLTHPPFPPRLVRPLPQGVGAAPPGGTVPAWLLLVVGSFFRRQLRTRPLPFGAHAALPRLPALRAALAAEPPTPSPVRCARAGTQGVNSVAEARHYFSLKIPLHFPSINRASNFLPFFPPSLVPLFPFWLTSRVPSSFRPPAPPFCRSFVAPPPPSSRAASPR